MSHPHWTRPLTEGHKLDRLWFDLIIYFNSPLNSQIRSSSGHWHLTSLQKWKYPSHSPLIQAAMDSFIRVVLLGHLSAKIINSICQLTTACVVVDQNILGIVVKHSIKGERMDFWISSSSVVIAEITKLIFAVSRICGDLLLLLLLLLWSKTSTPRCCFCWPINSIEIARWSDHDKLCHLPLTCLLLRPN